jgi:hypothetical protein
MSTVTKIWRDLKVLLTEEEWAAVSLACANEEQVLDAAKASMKEAVTEFKENIAASEKKMRALNEMIRTHKETRAVECFEKHDVNKFTVELYRMDTGEMVESRPMTASERHAATQPRLPGTDLRSQGAYYGNDNPTTAQTRHFREVNEDAKAEARMQSDHAAAVKLREEQGVPEGMVSTISASGHETITHKPPSGIGTSPSGGFGTPIELDAKAGLGEPKTWTTAKAEKPKKMSGAARRKLKREAAERGE